MCSAELLHKWSPDSPVKGKGAHGPSFRVSMKDYAAWHSRISNLIFFCILLGTGAVFGVITTLNVLGYFSIRDSGFLATGFAALPPHEEFHSVASEEPSSEPVLSSSTITTTENTTLVDDELLDEDRAEAPSSS